LDAGWVDGLTIVEGLAPKILSDRKTVWDTLEKRIVNKDNVRNHKDATIANKPTQSNYVNSW